MTIHADVLDWAAIDTLSSNLKKEYFLKNILAAWEQDEGEAADTVRIAKAALDEAQSNLANLASWAARVPPDSAAGATLQVQLNQANDTLPGLRQKYANAVTAREQVRANSALADELRMWFDAWLDGFYELPNERQRQFLESIHAKVTLWQEGDPTRAGLPRAELVIGLPTDVLYLPTPYPDDPAWMNVTIAPDGWHMPLDIASATQTEQDIADGFAFDNEATPEEAAELDERRRAWLNADAATVMRLGREEMRERAEQYDRDNSPPHKPATTP